MKLFEITKDHSELIKFEKTALQMGYVKTLERKVIKGKEYKVYHFTNKHTVDSSEISFQYIINPSTESWIFGIFSKELKFEEFSSGEDYETLIEHLRKKHKVNRSQLDRFLTQDE